MQEALAPPPEDFHSQDAPQQARLRLGRTGDFIDKKKGGTGFISVVTIKACFFVEDKNQQTLQMLNIIPDRYEEKLKTSVVFQSINK